MGMTHPLVGGEKYRNCLAVVFVVTDDHTLLSLDDGGCSLGPAGIAQ